MHPNRHAEAYTDTETHPSSAPTITRVRAHQNLQAPSLSNTEIGPETNRSAQKHKGMGTRRERSKQHTNAHLEASRAPHPGTPNPTPMHPDLHDTHPRPQRASGHRHIPFQTFGKTTGGDFNSCDFLSTLAVKVLLVPSLEMYRHQDTISLFGFHLELGCLDSMCFGIERDALIFNFGECGITPLLLVEMKMCWKWN